MSLQATKRGRAFPPCWAALWLAIAVLALGPAQAHVAGTMGYATVTVHGGTVRYSLTLGVDALAATGSDAAPGARWPLRDGYDALSRLVARKVAISADGGRCEPVPDTVTPPSPDRANVVVVVVHYACPGTLREITLHDDFFDTLGRDYHTLISVEAPWGVQRYTLEADDREMRVIVAPPAEGGAPERLAGSGLLAFFRLGLEHILTGFDHLLFLLALVLRGGSIGSLLAIVTAFTVAHSITLALAVLNVVSPPAWIVEPVIALSIVYVAAENIFAERAASRRWAVSFAFGLVHGFGFAGALLELDLPTAALVGSLLSFNLGVEAGQAMVIAVLLPALMWLRGADWERRATTTFSALVLTAGLALLIERVLVTAS